MRTSFEDGRHGRSHWVDLPRWQHRGCLPRRRGQSARGDGARPSRQLLTYCGDVTSTMQWGNWSAAPLNSRGIECAQGRSRCERARACNAESTELTLWEHVDAVHRCPFVAL